MNTSTNPYSPGKPVEYDGQFIDREQVISQVKRCLGNGKSCAIIGGMGMGKSSVLKRVKRIFYETSAPRTLDRFSPVIVPVYFKPDLRKSSTLRSVYAQLVDDTSSQIKEWLEISFDSLPENALRKLDQACRLIETTHSTTPSEDFIALDLTLFHLLETANYIVPNIKVVFLLDDIYRLENDDVREAFARHWFEVLDEENTSHDLLRSYVIVVITCLIDHVDQFFPRKSNTMVGPIRDPIQPIYLRVLEQQDAALIIRLPFERTLGISIADEVVEEVYQLTGGHPLLTQDVMNDLWFDVVNESHEISAHLVQDHALEWSSGERHSNIYRWISEVICQRPILRPVLELLTSNEGSHEQAALLQELEKQPDGLRFNHQILDALRMLECLGVVRKESGQAYGISGTLFKTWFTPLISSTIRESDYRSRIAALDKYMTVTCKRLDELVHISGVHDIRVRLKEELITLRTTRTQLSDMEESLSPGNPIRSDEFAKLLRKVEEIRCYVQFDLHESLCGLDIRLNDL
jgi:hypothetical protein